MAKIDEVKEYIGALKVYLALITALLISDISGTVKLYLQDSSSFILWLGIATIFVLASLFLMIAKHMHKKIKELKDLK